MVSNIHYLKSKNIKYLNDNNIDIPENLKDSDGWKHNIFYTLYPQNFIKKYNIITYYTHTINSNRHYYLYVVKGTLNVNGLDLMEGDGLSFVNENMITIVNPNSEIILFDLR